MKKNWKIFWLFSKYSWKTIFMSPLGVILFTLGKLIRFGIFFFFLFFLVTKTKVLAGYNVYQVLIFFLTFNLLDSLAQVLFREVYRFRHLVINAELDTVLTKPYHPFLRVLIGGVDYLDVFMTFIYIGLLIFFFQKISFSFLSLCLYFGLLINGLFIETGFHILVLSLGILTTEVDHAIMIYRDLSRLGMLPIDFYQAPLNWIFTFILPIGIMMTYPVKVLFGLLNWQFIIISFIIGLLFISFSLYSWDQALKKYQSWGG